MGDRYAAKGDQNAAASPGASVLAIEGAATTRGRIYEFVLSSQATPADVAIEWLVRRISTLGTRTAVTPSLLDPASPAALLAAGSNHTVEPTFVSSSSIFDQGINLRATFRWVAYPGGELIVPVTSSAGWAWTTIHASSTAAIECVASWVE